MVTVIKLNQQDLVKIIAEHFDVMEHQVELKPYIDTTGYGMAETQVARVSAEVTQN